MSSLWSYLASRSSRFKAAGWDGSVLPIEDLAVFLSEMVLGKKASASHFDIESRSGRGDVFDLVIQFADRLFEMETISPEDFLAQYPQP
ncbi:hypothetical protein KX729_32745 [Rhizobium sp. XQZ8]|uniref:hypothetical protein n=1 Tax=Rhizobium populisoli TaxID=2859785 RepID=UPI001CA4D58F|nr:hypothetical protein [Rhizobium populisoli]MBW6426129.1 hypothetical protein [Rhizobium populisoli]